MWVLGGHPGGGSTDALDLSASYSTRQRGQGHKGDFLLLPTSPGSKSWGKQGPLIHWNAHGEARTAGVGDPRNRSRSPASVEKPRSNKPLVFSPLLPPPVFNWSDLLVQHFCPKGNSHPGLGQHFVTPSCCKNKHKCYFHSCFSRVLKDQKSFSGIIIVTRDLALRDSKYYLN